jgi:predicted  nucleic acid-binding Zn-ribbon protein
LKPITTYDAVRAAVKELNEAGQDVTIRSVQAKMGGGNLGKIGEVLKQVYADAAANLSTTLERGGKYKEVLAAVTSAIDSLVNETQRLGEEAQAWLAKEVDECHVIIRNNEDTISDLSSRLAEAQDTIKSLTVRLELQESALSSARDEKEGFRERLQGELANSLKEASYYKGLYEGATIGKITQGAKLKGNEAQKPVK